MHGQKNIKYRKMFEYETANRLSNLGKCGDFARNEEIRGSHSNIRVAG